MLRLRVYNISELAPESDYKYVVDINGDVLDEGFLRGHKRGDGWKKLLELIVEDLNAK